MSTRARTCPSQARAQTPVSSMLAPPHTSHARSERHRRRIRLAATYLQARGTYCADTEGRGLDGNEDDSDRMVRAPLSGMESTS